MKDKQDIINFLECKEWQLEVAKNSFEAKVIQDQINILKWVLDIH